VESLLRRDARTQTLEVVGAYFTEDVFLEWLESIDRVSYLKSELAEIPATFEALYIRREPIVPLELSGIPAIFSAPLDAAAFPY